MINVKILKDKFQFLDSELKLIDSELVIIEKFNWDYNEAHEFQQYCVEHVLNNSRDIFLIFTSHPNVLTMGRGLQKLKNSTRELIEFDPQLKTTINTPVIDIKRGGGLTFHHTGQFVFYPILKTTEYNLKVHDLMLDILEITKNSLNQFIAEDTLVVNSELLGLWLHNSQKIASIGLAVNRFVTYHGLALNFFSNEEMKNEISKLHPCGLPGNLYNSVENISDKNVNEESFKEFKTLFENNFYAMIERQRSSVPTNDLISEAVSLKKVEESNSNIELSLS